MMKNVYTTSYHHYPNFFCVKYKNSYVIVIFDNNKIIYLSNSYKYNNTKGIYINGDTKVISCNTAIFNDFLKSNTYNLNFYFEKYFDVFFKKIKFIGKGFRIQYFKNKKVLNFTFGHSHMYMMFIQQLFLKKINKFKYFFKETDLKKITVLSNNFKKIKPINKYTLRGLRINRCIIVKRKGRKSPNL